MKLDILLYTLILMLSLTGCARTQSMPQSNDAPDYQDIALLSAEEHLSRGGALQNDRKFPEARAHWMKYLANYKEDPAGSAKALFGVARGYMWERKYEKAIGWFDKLKPDFLSTKEGRDGMYFRAACYTRLSRSLDAANAFREYIELYPDGDRIEGAHTNMIDNYREGGFFREANDWVARTRTRFAGAATEVNALQAKIRMEIARGNWDEAIAAADTALTLKTFRGSIATPDEIRFLKAFALERAGKNTEAAALYSEIPDSIGSYWGGLASASISRINPKLVRKTVARAPTAYNDYPVLFKELVLKESRARKVDPRFILAIMKQESSFNPRAKSPAAARGLLQLVYDTAIKYNREAGYPEVTDEDLYRPETNVAIGAVYIAALSAEFNGMLEAVAASYNGGEDNALRWLNRTNPKEPGIFTAEVGFSETKNYVYKVMGNYRAYVALYDEDLSRK